MGRGKAKWRRGNMEGRKWGRVKEVGMGKGGEGVKEEKG
jgi:hypothetical protein